MDAELANLLADRAGALGAARRDGTSRARRPALPRRRAPRCCGTAATGWWPRSSTRRGRAAPQPFERYVRSIVGERVAEGFALREVQHALSALESRLWPLVVDAGGDTATVVRRLALVTGIVGRGKDELARAFLDQQGEGRGRGREPVPAPRQALQGHGADTGRLRPSPRATRAPAAAPDPAATSAVAPRSRRRSASRGCRRARCCRRSSSGSRGRGSARASRGGRARGGSRRRARASRRSGSAGRP